MRETERESGEKVGVVSEANGKVTLVVSTYATTNYISPSQFEYQLLLSTVLWRHKCSASHFTSSDWLDGRDCIIFAPLLIHHFMAQLY